MKLAIFNRQQLQLLGSFLVNELDNLITRIRGSWNVEHKEDDTHGHVHADSVATGRIVFADIVEADINQAQTDNFTSKGLDTAALLRIGGNSATITTLLTGIQVPRDEKGQIIDGRWLTLENTSDTASIFLPLEHTSSVQPNRFILPYNAAANTSLVQIAPRKGIPRLRQIVRADPFWLLR